MTSAERHEARYQRRKAVREAKRYEQIKDSLDFDKVFSFSHLYRSAQECYKGVTWKASVQEHKSRCGIKVEERYEQLQRGELKLSPTCNFQIRERGKERDINGIGINDRVPQKCNSKYALKPVLHRSVLLDNYASQEDKGTTFARKRLKEQLINHIRHYGMTGGVITLDLHHFFDSIPHSEIYKLLKKNFDDLKIVGFNMRVVRNNKEGDVGVVLGSENSQDFAIAVPSILDHYIKEKLGVEAYGRYMDDIWIIDPDYERLKDVLQKIKEFVANIGFELNEKKTRLVRFGKQFKILKRKYDFTPTGHIIIRPTHDSVVRERRKLKKLYKKLLEGKVTFDTVWNSLQSWKASISDTKSWKIQKSIDKLFNELFYYPWIYHYDDLVKCK